MNIVFIGSGNVSTHMSVALKNSGCNIVQIYSRTMSNAALLAKEVNAEPIDDISLINCNADLYLFSIKDDAITQIVTQMPETTGIFVHTAGSIPVDIFKKRKEGYGVIYPLQTFSKKRKLNFREIPLFIEANSSETLRVIESVAERISDYVKYLESEKRRYIHLAAVFANNFSNHMFTLASEILEDKNIPFEVLKPLIIETVAKVMEYNPKESQTGPAVRFDEGVMANHCELLKSDLDKEIYKQISESIHLHHRR